MTDKKVTPHRMIPSVSRAPEPPNYISGGRSSGSIKSKSANFDHWNKLPLVSLDEAIMLILGLEPGSRIQDREKQQRHDELQHLAKRCQEAGTLAKGNDYSGRIVPGDVMSWASASGIEIPEQWKPVGVSANPATEVKREKKKSGPPQDAYLTELREVAIKLCVKKVKQGVTRKHITVMKISKELYENGRFENNALFSTQWRTSETIRGHLKGTNNPKRDERYKNARPDKVQPFN